MPSRTDWQQRTTTGQNQSKYWVFTRPIHQSPNDYRKYQIIRLDNGLEAILVHDPKADQAEASLVVGAGAELDPDGTPGLAHFCEHLFFMGSELYKGENEYENYIYQNGGSCNASTRMEDTDYHFVVNPTALRGALQRFSALFHCPLFPTSSVAREINAMHSEFMGEKLNDEMRFEQLKRHLSREGHTWKKFSLGNRHSLMGCNEGMTVDEKWAQIRELAFDWWRSNYCASRMRLCVIGREPLVDLTRLVVGLFSPIKRLEGPLAEPSSEHPYGPDERGRLVFVRAPHPEPILRIIFPMESQQPLWLTQPAAFLSYILGHEGQGSLDAYLKGKGWITSLLSDHGCSSVDAKVFTISIQLTESGFQRYQTVLATIFYALTTFSDSPTSLPAYLHRERATMDDIKFRFLERGSEQLHVAEELSRALLHPHVPKEEVLSWSWTRPWVPGTTEDGEPKLREYLEEFSLENTTVLLSARDGELAQVLDSEKEMNWETEPWYGTEFCREIIDEDFLELVALPNDLPEDFVPLPNEFIPTRLVQPSTNHGKQEPPRIIHKTASSTLWYVKDRTFLLPKATVYIDIQSSAIRRSDTARTSLVNQIWLEILKDSLTKDVYCAQVAGLELKILRRGDGFRMIVHGFNEKLASFVGKIFDKVSTMRIGSTEFVVVREKVRADLENMQWEQPHEQSDRMLDGAVDDPDWNPQDKIPFLDSITRKEVEAFRHRTLRTARMRILVSGALCEEVAIRIATTAETGLGLSRSGRCSAVEQCIGLPLGCDEIRFSLLQNPTETNSSLTCFFQYGPESDRRIRVVAELLTNMMKEPIFHRLRTREQLGYYVQTTHERATASGQVGMRVTVQSEKSPLYCQRRLSAFLRTFRSTIEEMSPERFGEYKTALRGSYLAAPENMKNQAKRYWLGIESWDQGSGDEMYDRAERDAAFLGRVSKEDVLDLFMSSVHPESEIRRTLCIFLSSSNSPDTD